MFSQKLSFGIIGYGRFGKFLVETLQKHWKGCTLKVSSNSNAEDNKLFYLLSEVCKSDIVIPCMPISKFEEVLKKIKPLLSENTTIMDVCSVKSYPVKWMKQILGENHKIIASHPMFGPDGTNNGKEFKGCKLVLHNISSKDFLYKSMKIFWESLGVEVLDMAPEEHDKHAAYSINFNHLFGQVSKLVNLKPTPIDTKGFAAICDALHYVLKDSDELFYDMELYNPYSKEMVEKVKNAFLEIDKRLQKKGL